MIKKRRYSGVNIQFPISQLILSREKVVETRTYPIPEKFVDTEVLLIETPGRNGRFKARAVAILIFGPSFQYDSEAAFYSDFKRHLVDRMSPWKWNKGKPKFGWPIKSVSLLEKAVLVRQTGIRYRSGILI